MSIDSVVSHGYYYHFLYRRALSLNVANKGGIIYLIMTSQTIALRASLYNLVVYSDFCYTSS